MSSTAEHAVLSALKAALRDQGWAAVTDPARLRALLSDLLGAQADEHRGALDAIVISAEEGIPADLQDAGRSGAAALRPALVARLQEWGLTPDRAAWVIAAWEPLVPEVTIPPAPPMPPQPATELPPSTPPEPTSPVAPAVTMPPTELPAAAEPVTAAPQIEPTVLPPTSLPGSLPSPSPTATALPADVPPGPTQLPAEARLPTGPTPESTPESTPAPTPVDGDDESGRRPRWPLVAAAVIVLALGGGTVAALNGSGGEDPPDGSPSAQTEGVAAESGELFSAPDAAPAEASGEFAMAGKDGGVRITALGTIDQVTVGEATRVAPAGEELLAFTLANGPCEVRPCDSWDELGLAVAVDGQAQPLPAGGPTFVVSAAAGDEPVELVFSSDGIEQRLSLRDGEPAADNIEVLLRSDRRTRIGVRKPIEPTASNTDGSPLSFTLAGTRMTAIAKSAELFYFGDHEPPPSADQAYLKVDLTYTRGGSTNSFQPSRLVTFEANGESYDLRDLAPGDRFEGAFLVPANLSGGTLVVAGSREVPTVGGQSYLETIPRTTFKVRF